MMFQQMGFKQILSINNFTNKKVLLRERKRHTAGRVASARYAALSNGWGVTHPDLGQGTHPDLGWGTPTQTWDRVPPHPDLGWGTPRTQTWDGVPPTQTWDGYPLPPRPEMG